MVNIYIIFHDDIPLPMRKKKHTIITIHLCMFRTLPSVGSAFNITILYRYTTNSNNVKMAILQLVRLVVE
jgi:hypothetical protein